MVTTLFLDIRNWPRHSDENYQKFKEDQDHVLLLVSKRLKYLNKLNIFNKLQMV